MSYETVESLEPQSIHNDGIRVSQPCHVTPGQKEIRFRHDLCRCPFMVQVQFSPNAGFDDDVHILEWPWSGFVVHNENPAQSAWGEQLVKGPVTIKVDHVFTYLYFSDGAVYQAWTPVTGWKKYEVGYFRVITL